MDPSLKTAVVACIAAAVVVVAYVWASRNESRRARHRMFSDRYGLCVTCGRYPEGHEAWLLASAVSSKKPNSVDQLERTIENRDWAAATVIREFEGTEDEIEYVAIKCPDRGEITLKKVMSVAELSLNDRYLEDVRLNPQEQERIDQLAAGDWQSLQAST